MLLAAIIMVFLVLVALSVAAPKVAMELKRDKELESQRRAQQYDRAIRIYYQKLKHYPGSVDQLVLTNNQRFLRQKYIDPLTGKDNWRLIHVGENKTTVKGFFGQDLPGLAGGLGAAAGLSSGSGGTTAPTGTNIGSAFNNTPGSNNQQGSNQQGTSGTNGTTGSSGSSSGSGIQSTDVSGLSGSGGPIMGVGSSATGDSLLTVNGTTDYQDWEFLYDPRIEQLYAKGNLLGGIGSGTPGTSIGSGFPAPPNTNGPVTTPTPTPVTPQ